MNKHDAENHNLELHFLRLQSRLEQAKTELGLCNLEIAELTLQYAKRNKVSQDDATLTLIRLSRLVRNTGPNL